MDNKDRKYLEIIIEKTSDRALELLIGASNQFLAEALVMVEKEEIEDR